MNFIHYTRVIVPGAELLHQRELNGISGQVYLAVSHQAAVTVWLIGF